MAIYDQNGNEITLAEMAQQIADALAVDQEMWVRPDAAARLRDFTEGHERGHLAALEKDKQALAERDLFRKQLEWSATHGHARGERHAEGASEALEHFQHDISEALQDNPLTPPSTSAPLKVEPGVHYTNVGLLRLSSIRYGHPCHRCGSCVWPHVCVVTGP